MNDVISAIRPLEFVWETQDPFLFCVHHNDHYPAGNSELGPAALLADRNLGQDFKGKDGWRMYHGQIVPGFPQHPHRGFETVTIVRKGFIDHADSLGATARFGDGDVQWLTAGAGIVHSEMFPLLKPDAPNPVELFQIWLNLPAADKLVDPHFAMLWSRDVPVVTLTDAAGRKTELTIIAGALAGQRAPNPPPHSWAARADTDVAIWSLRLEPNAKYTLPPAAHPESKRSLYFFAGGSAKVAGHAQSSHAAFTVRSDVSIELEAGPTGAEFLLLQGRPIAEPVVQHGPFVMNTRAEIQRAFADYQRTQFGRWPWRRDDPVHPREQPRFAKRPDGTIESPT